jgi:hypothetical protein
LDLDRLSREGRPCRDAKLGTGCGATASGTPSMERRNANQKVEAAARPPALDGRRVEGRLPAVDMTKGLAAIFVFFIHGGALHDTFAFAHVVNRAVPMFFVLFGMNAVHWWSRPSRTVRLWYAHYLRRVLVPVWAILPILWAAASWSGPGGHELTASLVVANLLGQLPNVGAAQFVTTIVAVVVAFPVLQVVSARFGVVALLVVMVIVRSMLPLGWFFAESDLGRALFAVQLFGGCVAFGMLVATFEADLGPRAYAIAALAWALLVILREIDPQGMPIAHLDWMADCAFTVLLLGATAGLARFDLVKRTLGWFGVHSYGLYVAQILLMNLAVAFAARGFAAAESPWLRTALLALGATAVTAAVQWRPETASRRVRESLAAR